MPPKSNRSTERRTPPADPVARLGSLIRARRHSLGLTLVELAARSGLSQPFLSQLERGQAQPSMRSLNDIATALGTTGPALLALPSDPAVSLVRPGSGVEVDHVGGTARLVSNGERAMLPMEFRGGPREFQEYYQHGGDEFIYVIAGEIEFELEGVLSSVVLRSRDCLYYDPTARHRWRDVGSEEPWVLVVSNQEH
jgi:transcriptional regulator with XRE-family HTH domain